MRKTCFLIFVFVLIFLVSCSEFSASAPSDYNHVVIIGIDGAGGRFVKQAVDSGLAPNIKSLIEDGDCAYSFAARCETPSISAHNWGSFLTGVLPEKHKRDNTRVCIERYKDANHPTVFKVFRNVFPKAKLASIVGWSPINFGLIEPGLKVDKAPDVRFGGELFMDDKVTDMVVDYLEKNDTKLMFVHFDEVDETGHFYDYGSTQHINKISEIDSYIGKIYQACDENTLFIIVSDHGGEDGGHGGNSDAEMEITCIIHGKTVNSIDLSDFRPSDLPAIIYKAMNIIGPDNMDGSCPDKMFIQ